MRSFPNLGLANRFNFASPIPGGILLCMLIIWLIVLAAPAAPTAERAKIPVGTILPVSFEHSLSSKELAKGGAIAGRIMQDVPLPNKEKIPFGAKVRGTILDVVSAENGPASITFRLDSVEFQHSTIPLVTGLRAMAPFLDIQAAHATYQDASSGSPSEWATTMQIGGDLRYGSGGKVTNSRHRTVGKATTDDGVLVHLEDSPGSPCAGWPDGPERLQAVWVFSASACGLFDLKGMRIAHAGNTSPFGEITLTKDEGDIKIMKSSGMLLRVVR